MRLNKRINVIARFATMALCAVAAATAFAQTPANWIGGSSGDYDVGGNWDVGVVPVNNGTDYDVTIGNNIAVTFDVVAPASVTDFTLGTGSSFTMLGGRSFTIDQDAFISGDIIAENADFLEIAPGAAFSGNKARLSASAGGGIALYGTS